MSSSTVAVLGLGLIGEIWAGNLLEDGWTVRGWNRTPKPDFEASVPTVAEAVKGARYIFIVVADPPAVESVLEQALPHLKKGQMVIQSSTISAAWTLKFAERVEATGAKFLEAPFTGSKPAAVDRKTIFYLGGEEELVAEAMPVLIPLSQKLLHIGERGSASSLKLAMNVNIAHVAQGLSESLTLARRAGISDDIFFQALAINASRSPIADLKEPKLKSHDYSPQFSLQHMAKDLRLALETNGDAPLPQTRHLAKEIYAKGLEAGWAKDDFISLIKLLEG